MCGTGLYFPSIGRVAHPFESVPARNILEGLSRAVGLETEQDRVALCLERRTLGGKGERGFYGFCHIAIAAIRLYAHPIGIKCRMHQTGDSQCRCTGYTCGYGIGATRFGIAYQPSGFLFTRLPHEVGTRGSDMVYMHGFRRNTGRHRLQFHIIDIDIRTVFRSPHSVLYRYIVVRIRDIVQIRFCQGVGCAYRERIHPHKRTYIGIIAHHAHYYFAIFCTCVPVFIIE